MNPEKQWQENLREATKREREYQLWKLDFDCQLDCECDVCKNDKWKYR